MLIRQRYPAVRIGVYMHAANRMGVREDLDRQVYKEGKQCKTQSLRKQCQRNRIDSRQELHQRLN
jgi:hypothetical protein